MNHPHPLIPPLPEVDKEHPGYTSSATFVDRLKLQVITKVTRADYESDAPTRYELTAASGDRFEIVSAISNGMSDEMWKLHMETAPHETTVKDAWVEMETDRLRDENSAKAITIEMREMFHLLQWEGVLYVRYIPAKPSDEAEARAIRHAEVATQWRRLAARREIARVRLHEAKERVRTLDAEAAVARENCEIFANAVGAQLLSEALG